MIAELTTKTLWFLPLSPLHGKFVLKIIAGWADSFIVCPRELVTAWAQKRAHPTFVDFKHNYLKNKLALVSAPCELTILSLRDSVAEEQR